MNRRVLQRATFVATAAVRQPLRAAPRRRMATFEQRSHDRNQFGLLSPASFGILVLTGVGLYLYFEHKREEIRQKKIEMLKKQNTKFGKAAVGGPFNLITQNGVPFTEQDLLGKWSLVYFGFTNCPDICPDELDKMSTVVDTIDARNGPAVQPIFISCDPARDSNNAIREYLKDFHPRMVGLTGTYENVKATCKAYRVYFSTPPNVKPGDDYIVDHSIYFYLMDPNGEFVDAFGKDRDAAFVIARIEQAVKEHGEGKKNYVEL
ncbi:h-sco1 [Auriculariales sp. MPI-PUGE-AT-0066]|nr:h-sco1 [Auriculariales sp. MPI-PUGE-AT-0066]